METKFEAWDIKGERVIEVLRLRHSDEGIYAIEGAVSMERVSLSLFKDEFILMQFTNLKDKNNREIYFDHIVKWNNKLWVVVWSITLAGIELQPVTNYRKRQKNPKIKRLYGSSFGIGQAHSSEVLGYVHMKD